MPRRAAVALLAWLAVAGPASAETLAEVLRAHGVEPPAAIRGARNPSVRSYGVLVGSDDVVVGYYLERLPPYEVGPRLVVGRLDRRDGQWRTAHFGIEILRRGIADCTGSISEVGRTPVGYYVGTHLNPSAGCTVVVSTALEFRGVLDGWVLGAFRDGRIVYHRSQAHFVPVHPLAVAIYDPRTRWTTAIHPGRPHGPLRQAHIATLRRAWSDPTWCAARNHPCDPERFDERLVGALALDDQTGALAFATAFDNTVTWREGDRWRLEAFRELRAAASQGPASPEAMAAALLAGLGRARNLGAGAAVVAAFDGDPELQALLRAAQAAEATTGEAAGARLERADPGWARPETWVRLLQAVTTPPETTDVVYVYRPAGRGSVMEFRELARADLDARCGGSEVGACLTPGVLARLFGR